MPQEVEESTITERTITERTPLFDYTALVNTRGRSVDERRLVAALHRNPSGNQVVSLHVSLTSLLRTLSVAVALKNLRHVRIESRRLRDYQALGALPNLKELTIEVPRRLTPLPDLTQSNITGLGMGSTLKGEPAMIGRMKSLRTLVLVYAWPERSLDALSPLRLSSLEIKTSTIAEIGELDCRHLTFFTCRGCVHLSSVRGLDAEEVDIDTCRKLDLKTLAGQRIKVLALRNMKRIEDMSFLENCPNLQQLEVAATRQAPIA